MCGTHSPAIITELNTIISIRLASQAWIQKPRSQFANAIPITTNTSTTLVKRIPCFEIPIPVSDTKISVLVGEQEKYGSCHKRQKPQAPTPQAPIRNRQTRKVANAKGLNAILTLPNLT